MAEVWGSLQLFVAYMQIALSSFNIEMPQQIFDVTDVCSFV